MLRGVIRKDGMYCFPCLGGDVVDVGVVGATMPVVAALSIVSSMLSSLG